MHCQQTGSKLSILPPLISAGHLDICLYSVLQHILSNFSNNFSIRGSYDFDEINYDPCICIGGKRVYNGERIAEELYTNIYWHMRQTLSLIFHRTGIQLSSLLNWPAVPAVLG